MPQTVEEIYRQHIKPLPDVEKLRLITKVAESLAEEARPKRDIMELHGLGAEIWKGVNVEEYINEMRDEWDNRP